MCEALTTTVLCENIPEDDYRCLGCEYCAPFDEEDFPPYTNCEETDSFY